jgi:hypothetical protein
MVQEEGAQISITGSAPSSHRYAAHSGQQRHVAGLARPHRAAPALAYAAHRHAPGAAYAAHQRSRALAYGPGGRYRGVSSVKSWQSAPMSYPFGD